ncbi:MAG: DNA mismatch repair protein MutS [Erysipelotrichaceae bacterium]|nr:DNA mismatch repair protein MutS [Erysipelotrichaceae bacterium]
MEDNKTKYSPMVMQYLSIKENYKDTLILFRLGDFYELFFDDAKIASKVLELVLTGKNAGVEDRIPMCGVPYHAVNQYIEILIKNGYKVGIVEQLEDPATAKNKLVKRDVVQIITPGTLINLGLKEKDNNYIAYIDDYTSFYTLSYCDLSTGELNVINVSHDIDLLINELESLEIKEIVTTASFYENYKNYILKKMNIFMTISEEEAMPLEVFEITSSIKDIRQANTVSKLIYYLTNTQKRSIEYLKVANVLKNSQFMKLDNSSAINLELTRTIKSDERFGSLFWLLDKTKTAMGARLLKKYIIKPLCDVSDINKRLDIVEVLSNNYLARHDLISMLDEVYDLERLIAKISYGNANARDLLQLKKSFVALPKIKETLHSLQLDEYADKINCLSEMTSKLELAIVENPPLTIKEGGMIKDGYDSQLDDLKFALKDGKNYIANLEAKEREKTGIKNLKIGFNKVFGYYIEVTNSFLGNIKDEYNYIRKQTTTNSERFITPELKEKEKFILSADDKIMALEFELFNELRTYIKTLTKQIQDDADIISFIDVMVSFAEVSTTNHYVRPTFNDEHTILVKNGRHPVMEALNRLENYVPNDVNIEKDKHFVLISGPNMGGKSTFMKQVALASIMAQIGCFVAADYANLPIFDGIFTRIGASDDLISGQSTFMVEMSEVNYALQYSTLNSLILFDEVGRGTATFDGMALAQAIIEYICKEKQCITLFSTHYHELTSLANSIDGLINLHAAVIEEDDKVTFLYKMTNGATNKSYGINVARLAHLPESLLLRAKEILNVKESNGNVIVTSQKITKVEKEKQPEYIKDLETLDPLQMSPLEALTFLFEIQKKIKERK